MKCNSVRKNLFFYREKSLPVTKMTEISIHLESCTGCQKYFQFFQKVTTTSNKDFNNIKPDPYFYTRLQAKLEKRNKRKLLIPLWILKRRLVPAIYVLLIVLAILLGINIGNFNINNQSSIAIIQNTNISKSDNYLDITSARQFIFENNYINMIENGNNKTTQIH